MAIEKWSSAYAESTTKLDEPTPSLLFAPPTSQAVVPPFYFQSDRSRREQRLRHRRHGELLPRCLSSLLPQIDRGCWSGLATAAMDLTHFVPLSLALDTDYLIAVLLPAAYQSISQLPMVSVFPVALPKCLCLLAAAFIRLSRHVY